MRVAILAPLKRAITPDVTASRPRVIFDLVSELIKRGHNVTIFGTGDSNVPGAQVVAIIPKALNLLPAVENPFYQHTAYLTLLIKAVLDRQSDFDIIHNHMYPEFLALLANTRVLPRVFPQEHPQGDPFLGASLPASPASSPGVFSAPLLTTVHAQMTNELSQALKAFPEAHLVAISEAAKKASGIASMTVIHNGIDTDFFTPAGGARDYLLFVGRMSKAKDEKGNFLDPKGVSNAIKIAQKSGEKLKIVGNVEDATFFEQLVKPHLNDKVEFVGEVSAEQTLTRGEMVRLFQGAKAFINPINWEEPFGLVMAEALACGTPVIAFNRGSVSEIVVNEKNGFVIHPSEGVDGFISKLSQISSITTEICRNDAVSRFSKSRMADDYESLYKTLT